MALLSPAGQVSAFAVTDHLHHVSANGNPALDLPFVFFRHPAAPMVSAVPLEPATGVCWVDPSLFSPYGKRLAGIDTEEIQCGIMVIRTEFCVCEPVFGKFARAVGHVFPAEDAESKHFLRREVGSEARIEVFSFGFGAFVSVILLHLVADGDGL